MNKCASVGSTLMPLIDTLSGERRLRGQIEGVLFDQRGSGGGVINPYLDDLFVGHAAHGSLRSKRVGHECDKPLSRPTIGWQDGTAEVPRYERAPQHFHDSCRIPVAPFG